MRRFTQTLVIQRHVDAHTSCGHLVRGFTLIETIIYVALFGILMVGIIVSIMPLFEGAERMSEKVLIENETTLVLRSIISLLPQAQSMSSPSVGAMSNTITFTTYTGVPYSFTSDSGAIVASVFSSPWTPLTASRVDFSNMTVKRVAASGGTPQYVELIYTVNGIPTAPIRSYLNF